MASLNGEGARSKIKNKNITTSQSKIHENEKATEPETKWFRSLPPPTVPIQKQPRGEAADFHK